MTTPTFPVLKNYLSRVLAPAFLIAAIVLPCLGQGRQRELQQPPEPGRNPMMAMIGAADRTVNLGDLWFLQSSEKVKGTGDAISQSGFRIDGWHPAVVPSTIMGTLVQNNVYPDIFVGENLKSIPTEPFLVSWWYRREFIVPPGPGTRHVRLEFDGINYRANIWLNGKKIGDAAEVFGPFRRFSFDVTGTAKPGDRNVLAVEVFPPKKGDFTIGFVDWNPKPPDLNMGIWREVRVRAYGDVAINHPFVVTKLNIETLKEARLTVSAELENATSEKVTGTLEGRINPMSTRTSQGERMMGPGPGERMPQGGGGIVFRQEVSLEPKETRKVVFTPESTPDLIIKDPNIWWTHELGRPDLYFLSLTFQQKGLKPPVEAPPPAEKTEETKGKGKEEKPPKEKEGPWSGRRGGRNPFIVGAAYSDIRVVRFGIREVSDYINEQGFRGFRLNGKNILVRGGGWVDDLFLDNRPRKVQSEVRYAVQMNLNAIRLEGFWGTSEELYNLCDANGLLMMVGWSCQWEWEDLVGKPNDEFGCIKSPEDIRLIAASWRDQVKWLRNHPSIFVWMEGSDTNPRPELEKEYIAILKEEDPTRPAVTSAKERTSELTGKSAVKMRGPYDYEPPSYWYVDKDNGGAFGFNTETGPGPQVPPLASLKKMFAEKDLWPINDVWYYHCARGEFFGLKRYNEAMDNRLGPAKDVEDYATKAQFLNYEGMRAMFEAFVANKYKATGVIQWMYNSAWPKLWWQLYDYYLNPTGAFYGARKAGEPLHLIYNYGTREIVAVNNTREAAGKLKAVIRVFDFALKELSTKTVNLELAADEVKTIDSLAGATGLTTTYFLDLRLLKEKDELADTNFYVLSTKPETCDFAKTEWYVTPVKTYADFTALNGLNPVRLNVKEKFTTSGPRQRVVVDLENPSRDLAFQVELRVVRDTSREEVLPIFWDDNYVTLLPGERRRIAGVFATDDLGGEQPALSVGGWNIKK